MNVYCPLRHRVACSLRLIQRAEQRGVEFSAEEIGRLEAAIEKLRPAFEMPDQDRYWITVKHHGERVRVLYDIRLRCLVTVWRNRAGVAG